MAERTRPFSLQHQRVVLDLDFAGVIKATTWLHIRPLDASLKTVHLHAAPCLRITDVRLSAPATDKLPSLGPLSAAYVHTNPLAALAADDKLRSIDAHPAIKRKLWTALAEKEEGELAVNVSHGWVRLDEVAYDARRAEVGEQAGLEEIVLCVEYEIAMNGPPGEGVVFRRPGDGGNDNRIPHVFLNSSSYDAARHWIPCVDNLWERCTWEMDVIVPRFLEMETASSEDDGGSDYQGSDQAADERVDAPRDPREGSSSGQVRRRDEDAERVVVVASGELEEQVVHPTDPSKIVFSYSQAVPTSVQHMSFAAGPFRTHVVSFDGRSGEQPELVDCEEDNDQPVILAFCLPGYEAELANSTGVLHRAMLNFADYGSYPFSTFKAVFVDELSPQCAVAAGMVTCAQDLLYPREVIDQAYITRPMLSHALASQWLGVNIVPRTWSDLWLVNGLAIHMNALFLKDLLGESEYRFKLHKEMERCVEMDYGDQFPISVPGMRDPPDPATLDFVNLKAPLVLQMLDRRMTRLGTSLGLSRVIPKIFLESLSGQLKDNQLSSAHFWRTCRKLSGVDWAPFAAQWVLGSGCPRLSVSARYDRPRKVVDFIIKQTIGAPKDPSTRPNKTLGYWQKPTQQFEGPITIRIFEDDDAPYEHVVDVPARYSRSELPFMAKIRRYMTGRRKIVVNGVTKEVDEEGPAPDAPAVKAESTPKDIRSQLLERFSRWSEIDQKRQVDQGFEYIRVDPDCEWLAAIHFEPLSINKTDMPGPLFWAAHITRERDVIGQLEGIEGILSCSTPRVPALLYETLCDETCFYRVRMAAAEALVQCNEPLCSTESRLHEDCDAASCSSAGAYFLLRYYHETHGNWPFEQTDDPFDRDFQPKSNDFSSPPEYFVQKAVIAAIACLRNRQGGVLPAAKRLLLSAAVDNNNEGNPLADGHFVAALVAALPKAILPDRRLATAADVRDVMGALDRAAAMDRLLPSFGNVVTAAVLQANLQLQFIGSGTATEVFLAATRDGNYLPLRIVALDCLMAARVPSVAVLEYCNHIMTCDSSLQMRRHVAQALPECWLGAFGRGALSGLHQAATILEANLNPTHRASTWMQQDLQALRQLLQADLAARTVALGNLLTPQTDLRIRMGMLTVLNLMHPGRSEDPAKLRLTLASTRPAENKALSLTIRPGSSTSGAPMIRLAPLLSREDKTAIQVSLSELSRDGSSLWFREPVSEQDAPGYYDIIGRPMDLATIKDKLKKQRYKSRDDYVKDIELIVSNALKYNNPGDMVYNDALMFRDVFKKSWSKLESQIAAAQKAQATVRRPSGEESTMRVRLTAPRPMDPPASTLPIAQQPKNSAVPALASRNVSFTPTIKLNPGGAGEGPSGKKRKPSTDTAFHADDDLDAELLDAAEGGDHGKIKRIKVAPPQAHPSADTPKINPFKIKLNAGGTPGTPTPAGSGRASLPPRPNFAPNLPARATPPLSANLPARPAVSPQPRGSPLPPARSEQPVKGANSSRMTVSTAVPYRPNRAKALLKVLSTKGIANGEVHQFYEDPSEYLNYRAVVAHPMWMRKIDNRISKGTYRSSADFASDIELMFNNARLYNENAPEFTKHVTEPTERLYRELWNGPYSAKSMNGEERKSIKLALNALMKLPEGVWFASDILSIDPVLRYFDTIPRENARDIPMILRMLGSSRYNTDAEVDADVYLMLRNAMTFNPQGDPVHEAAKIVGAKWDAERAKMEPGRRGRFA